MPDSKLLSRLLSFCRQYLSTMISILKESRQPLTLLIMGTVTVVIILTLGHLQSTAMIFQFQNNLTDRSNWFMVQTNETVAVAAHDLTPQLAPLPNQTVSSKNM